MLGHIFACTRLPVNKKVDLRKTSSFLRSFCDIPPKLSRHDHRASILVPQIQ
jgi:hypothetical protein